MMSKPNKDGYWLEVTQIYHDGESRSPDSEDILGVFLPVLPMEALLEFVRLAIEMGSLKAELKDAND